MFDMLFHIQVETSNLCASMHPTFRQILSLYGLFDSSFVYSVLHFFDYALTFFSQSMECRA